MSYQEEYRKWLEDPWFDDETKAELKAIEGDEKEIEDRCYWSRERVEEAIRSIGPEELESIIAEGKDVSVSCQFCDKVYSFTTDELRALRQE